MKSSFIIFFAFIVITSCQKQKIGFVDNGKVINEIQEKKDIEAKFETLNEAFKKRADSLGKLYQAEYQTLQTKAAKMSAKKQQETFQAFQAKAQQFQQQLQAEQKQLQTAYQTDIDSLITKMKNTVSTYGKRQGYTFILGTTEDNGTVLYGEESSNLSEILIDEIDKNYEKK